MLFWIVYILIYLPVKIIYPTKVIGRKNLGKGKAIYACNHQHWSDIPIFACGFNRRIYALAKAELFKKKLRGWFLKEIGCISVNRGEPDIGAVKGVLRILKQKDKPIMIFPTGHRESSATDVQEIKHGVAMFSVKAQAPIVPVVLTRKPRPFRINRMIIGEPLDMTSYEGRRADKQLLEEISQNLSKALEDLVISDKTNKK